MATGLTQEALWALIQRPGCAGERQAGDAAVRGGGGRLRGRAPEAARRLNRGRRVKGAAKVAAAAAASPLQKCILAPSF